jgi:COP9 signalosome complex subunit 6
MSERGFGIVQPLVVMSISDHYTRYRYINGDLKARVAGVLLGTRNAQEARIYNAFETKADLEGGSVDKEFTRRRLESYKEMFPEWEFLGWYSTDLELYDQDSIPKPLL